MCHLKMEMVPAKFRGNSYFSISGIGVSVFEARCFWWQNVRFFKMFLAVDMLLAWCLVTWNQEWMWSERVLKHLCAKRGGVKRVWIYMFCKYNLYIYILYVLMLQSGYTCFFVPDHVWMLQCHDVFGFLKRWPWFHQSNTPCSNSLGLESGYVDTSVKGWRSCVCSCHVFEKYQQQIHRWEFGVQFHVRNTHTPTWQRTESAEHGHHHTWAGDSITRNVPRNLYSLETWKLETTHIPSTQVGVLSVEVLVLFDYKI